MKKRFLCLVLALFMILPICFMTSCGTSSDDAADKVTEEASKTTKTLTMYLITERHVYTAEEVEAIKAEKGEFSEEYREAKEVMESYANVATALDNITKSKFRTHLVISFYTIEEYKEVEALMQKKTDAEEMRKLVAEILKEFIELENGYGEYDNAVIQSKFNEAYPEYAPYVDTIKGETETTVETEEETYRDSLGIIQLKYPDAKPDQVDIVCVCGYDKFLEYTDKNWLVSIDDNLSTSSKAIYTYINEKFLDAVKLLSKDNKTYAIPNNMAIGEYTYLLLNKELFDYYGYDINKLNNSIDALSSKTMDMFLGDILKYEKDCAPITGELELTNAFYWSLDYEYESVGTPDSLDKAITYYLRTEADGEYVYHRVSQSPESTFVYHTITATPVKPTEEEFNNVNNVFHTFDPVRGNYNTATVYDKNGEYYSITSVASSDKAFDSEKAYYTRQDDGSFFKVYTFEKGTEYFVVNDATINEDKFSLLCDVFTSFDIEKGNKVGADITASSYKEKMQLLISLKEKGYYVADALDKKFASAIVKGGADLAAVYGDQYYMLVLEYPMATTDGICQNMFAVSASSVNIAASMEIITYLTTNPDFRNLLQYGIEGVNYTLSYFTPVGSAKKYPVVTRLNNYYQMDINKTGNVFIAYPEEDMIYNIWDYGKKQNADVRYDPTIEFVALDYVNRIDFSVVDDMAKLSAKYEAMINDCDTVAEFLEIMDAMEAELNSSTLYRHEISEYNEVGTYNPYGIYSQYLSWRKSAGYDTAADDFLG